MQPLNTVLNISNLSYQALNDDKLQKHSLLFSYLFATNPVFRKLSESKQLSYILKYRIALHKQLETLSKKSHNNKLHAKLIANDPSFLENLSNEDSNVDDILFIVFHEVLKTKYKTIIYKDEAFIFPNAFDDNDTFLILYLNDSGYHPVAIDNEFIFSSDNQNIILMKLFTTNTDDNNDNNDNDDIDDIDDSDDEKMENITNEQNTFDETINPIQNNDEQRIILLDENNISIYDLDDYVSFFDTNISINFTDEEFDIECVKLFNDDIVPTNSQFSTIMNQGISHNLFYNHDYLINIELQFNSVNEENMLNSESFLKKRTAFKSKFSWKPFFDPPYIQTTSYPSLIISDTSAVVLNDMTNNYLDAETECKNDMTIENLKKIASTHKIQLKGSKKNICRQLTSYNFILDHMISAYKSKYSNDQLRSIANEYNISTHNIKSTNDLIAVLIDNNALSNFCDTSALTLDDYYTIAKKHNLKSFDNLENACLVYSHYNLLEDSMKTNNPISVCHEDIQQFTTDVDEIHFPHNQNYIKILPEDDLYATGIFIKNDPTSDKIHRFNIDEYVIAIKKISKFPINCNIYYHFNDTNSIKQEKGSILSREDELYKIKTKKRTFFYNLNDLSNNDCFIFTLFHDEYHFNKFHLFTLNIHIISEKLTLEQIRSIISVKPREYNFMYNQSVHNELSTIDSFLFNFNTSFFKSHNSVLSILKKQVSPIVFSENKNTTYISKYKPSSFALFKSLDDEYDFNSVDDLERIKHIHYNLDEQDYIWKYIEPKLITFKKQYDIIIEDYILEKYQHDVGDFNYETRFSSFEELVDFKNKFLEYLKEIKHKNVNQIYNNLKNTLINFSSIVNEIIKRNFRATVFKSLVHDKQLFVTSKQYDFSHKTKTHHGDNYQEDILKHTNDNILFVSPLQNPSVQTETKDLLDLIWDILGIKHNARVKRYLHSKLNTYLAFMIKLLLRSHAAKQNKDANTFRLSDVFRNHSDKQEQWMNYSKITFFCAYTCILINTNHIYINKQNVNYQQTISYLGYPNPEEFKTNTNKKTLSHYLSSVMVFYFAQTNSNFKTVANYSKMIEQIVKLILSYEPELVTLINNNYQHRMKLEQCVSNTYSVNFNPQQSSEIRTYVKNNINETNVSKAFKLTKYMKNNQYELIDSTKLLRKLYIRSVNKYNIKFNFPRNVSFIDTNTYTSEVQQSTEDQPSNSVMGVEIQDLILKMTEHYKLDFKDFISTFISSSNTENVKKYYFILNNSKLIIEIRNELIRNLDSELNTVNTISEKLSKVITRNTYDVTRNVYNFLLSILEIFKIVFKTTEPFTFIDSFNEPNDSKMYEKLILLLQKHINFMISFVKQQTISFAELSLKKNEYRNEDQLNELNKYSGVGDEEIYLIKSLQKLGISIDISQKPQDSSTTHEEHIGESFKNVPSSDDDIEE
jgi:hypothetical protein